MGGIVLLLMDTNTGYKAEGDFLCRYAKSKDSFGWPEETEEVTSNTVVPTPATTGTTAEAAESAASFPPPISSLDKSVTSLTFVIFMKLLVFLILFFNHLASVI